MGALSGSKVQEPEQDQIKKRRADTIINRKGKVKVDTDLLEYPDCVEWYKRFCDMFSVFMPFDIKREDRYLCRKNNTVTVYTGLSEYFDEIKEGDLIPEYRAVFTRHERGKLSISFRKII